MNGKCRTVPDRVPVRACSGNDSRIAIPMLRGIAIRLVVWEGVRLVPVVSVDPGNSFLVTVLW